MRGGKKLQCCSFKVEKKKFINILEVYALAHCTSRNIGTEKDIDSIMIL